MPDTAALPYNCWIKSLSPTGLSDATADNYGTFLRAVISACLSDSDNTARPPVARKTLSLLLAGVLVWPAVGLALGLGQLSGEAIIGESLQLEVPLTGTMDRPIDNECVSVRRTTDAIDAEYFPRDLVARVDRQSGAPKLWVLTRSAIRQPLVEFRVFVGCGYNLSHDYMVMAGPRSEAVPAVVAAPAPKAVTSSAPQQSVRPAAIDSTASAASVLAPATLGGGLPDGIAGKNFVVDKDMTLQDVARLHFPGPLRQQRFMRWVVEANPQYFAGANNLRHQKLPSGTQLVVPNGVPPRRPGDHQGNLTPLGERVDDVAASEAQPKPAPKPKAEAATGQGATKTVGNGRKDRLVVSGGSSAKSMKETIALVDQLTGMMEKQLAAQNAYNEKIQLLEANVDALGKQIKTLEDSARQRDGQWQAALQAEKTAREQEAERTWWNLLIAVAIGGLVAGGLMLATRLLFSRQRRTEDAFDDIPDAPVESPTPTKTAAAREAGPLTEFGWDDDAHPASKSAAAPAPKPAAATVPKPVPAVPAAAAPAAPKPAPTPAKSNQIDFELPTGLTPSPTASYQEVSDPATAAIELANIMTSMGLAESAAQTLVEHIRENPRESLPQWLKLLEIHRLNGNRSEFERSATELRQHFNVQPEDWSAGGAQGRTSLESYPHIRSQVIKMWRKPECAKLLRALLLDNREGTRLGFPLPVAEEILLLVAILNGSQ
jgi:hypothetical protein